jgi:preprotein translocase subunit Sec63
LPPHEVRAHGAPPHEVLGVRPGAPRREVATAFRRYAARHHPDRGGDRTRFQAGVDAYRSLTDQNSRPAAATGPRADVVFHRRPRPGIPSLLRLARRRLSADRRQR